MAAELAILAEGVRKRFGDVVAVDGVSLAIPRGEIFGLVGPDGAGKTTMMRLLAALFPPDEGILRVAGHDIVRDPESVRPRLGYLSQRFSMYGELTVAENIAFFAEMFGVPRAARREREAELLQMTRLAPFRDRRAQDLSGGMKQKLALICTLIHRPEVIDPLVMDDLQRAPQRTPQGIGVLDALVRVHYVPVVQPKGICQIQVSARDTEVALQDRLCRREHGAKVLRLRQGRGRLRITGQQAVSAPRKGHALQCCNRVGIDPRQCRHCRPHERGLRIREHGIGLL